MENSSKGFTLPKILMVVAIIALLAIIAIPVTMGLTGTRSYTITTGGVLTAN